MMTETLFWQIVDEMSWPETDPDDVKFRFMKAHSIEEAEQFREIYIRKRNELVAASGKDFCCDSWDDTLAHIIGLGEEEYQRHIDDPELIVTREQAGDYTESFSYCIPYIHDFAKLTDEGYETYLEGTKKLLIELDNADEDDIPPRLFRQFPNIKEVCRLLIAKNWQQAVSLYHNYFGSAYADDWPLHGYCIPNFVADLERFRLREE